MKKDPYLKDLFANYNPPLSDDEEFLNNLTQRLDTIEPARRYYSRERRHLHRSLVDIDVHLIVVVDVDVVAPLLHVYCVSCHSY